jgi:hypothetical protein
VYGAWAARINRVRTPPYCYGYAPHKDRSQTSRGLHRGASAQLSRLGIVTAPCEHYA